MVRKITLNILSLALLIQAGVFLYGLVYLEGTVLKAVSFIMMVFFVYFFIRACIYINIKGVNKTKRVRAD